MQRGYNVFERDRNYMTQSDRKNLKEGNYLQDAGISVRIMLQWFLHMYGFRVDISCT